MEKTDFLKRIQMETGTQGANNMPPVGYDILCRDMRLRISPDDEDIVEETISSNIQDMLNVQLPTPYEDVFQYYILKKNLDNLLEVRKHTFKSDSFFNRQIDAPVIGSANIGAINAYANVKYNTIIVCRSLPYFFLSMSDLIIPLIVDDNGMIRPFELTVEVLKTKIVSNKYLLKNYLDLLCCYVLFGEVSYHEPYNSKNTKYYIFADQVANNCIKFVVAHELTHILLQHEGSKESNEYEADYYGSYMCMCASMNDSFLKEHPMYMPLAIAIAMKSMDVLQKVDIQFKGCESISHPNDRIGILVKALTDMKAVSRQKEIVRVVHSILTLLSYTVDRPLEGMIEAFKRGLIHSIDDVRKYISYL